MEGIASINSQRRMVILGSKVVADEWLYELGKENKFVEVFHTFSSSLTENKEV